MFYKDLIEVLYLLKGDVITRNIAIIVILFCSSIGLFLSPLTASLIFSNYILGFIVCWCLIKYQKNASICLHRLVSFYRIRLSSNKHVTASCGICNETLCDRHKLTKKTLPWKKIHITKCLNNSIEHFYNRLIDTFVTSWYSTLTKDTSFLNELRFSLQYATATAVNKLLELDIGCLMANKMIPCTIKHIDDYLCMQQIAKLKNLHINKIAADYLGSRLHIAMTNREYELNYLRELTLSIMPKLLPQEYLNCSNYAALLREIFAGWVLLPVMDVLSDPNIINLFVVLGTNRQKLHSTVTINYEKTEMFSTFIKKKSDHSALSSDLKFVLKSQSLLYHFMQFLKKEGCVHILQFCLDVEQFNDKLILPDLSKRQLENLHTEALNLYKIYVSPKSSDFIGCSEEIVVDLYLLLEEGVYNVAKLRTSEPLYKAYDHAFGLLENDFLPEFYHSNEFYSYLCGTKVTAAYKKTSINKQNMPSHGSPSKTRSRKYEHTNQGTVSKISSGFGKIKGALQTKQPIEGYAPELQIYENDATHYIDDVMPHMIGFRDLTTWRISIKAFDTVYIPHSRIHNYFINIERIDTIPENELRRWCIQRRDNDFYTLKAKLIEFHGENEIPDLPPKRVLWAADPDSRKVKYEEFLKQLLQKPFLRSSDLLYTFLTNEQNFTETISASVPGVDLENIYQSVAHKLRKEKGQHLDSFMSTFLSSTGKIRQNKIEWAELGDELDNLIYLGVSSVTPKTFNNKAFGNNFGITQRKTEQASSSSFNPTGITESLFYLLKHTFKVSHSILKLYTAICNVAQYAFESLCKMFIEKKIKGALSQHNLAMLIEQLEAIVFEKHYSPTAQALEERKSNAFKGLENAIPNWLILILGDEMKGSVKSLLEILQNPLYNKQLAYNLLDIIIAELYPDLNV